MNHIDKRLKGLGSKQKEILKLMSIKSHYLIEHFDIYNVSIDYTLYDSEGNEVMDLNNNSFESLNKRDLFDSYNVSKCINIIQTKFLIKEDVIWKIAMI